MVLFDTSGTLYLFLESVTINITGTWFLTLLLLVLGFLLVCAVLRIRTEFSVLLVFPLLAYAVAVDTSMVAVLGVAIIYIAYLIAKNFFFWK